MLPLLPCHDSSPNDHDTPDHDSAVSGKTPHQTDLPLQLGKILALAYGIIGLLAVPFLLFMATMTAQLPPEQRGPLMAMGAGAALFAPILYAVVGFISGVIGAVIYNVVAKWVGGIEVDVE